MAQNGHGSEFTSKTEEILKKSREVAELLHWEKTTPVQLFLVALCGSSFDSLDTLNSGEFSPENPSFLWRALDSLAAEPSRILKTILSTPPPPPPPPLPSLSNEKPETASGSNRFGLQLSSRNKKVATPAPAPNATTTNPTSPDPTLIAVLSRARELKGTHQDLFISPFHLSLAVVEDPTVSTILQRHETSKEDVTRVLHELKSSKVTNQDDTGFKYLSRYATDMLALANAKKLDETIGRDEEIRRVIQILCRRTKNSAVLIGEPGVGKTAVVEGLAHRMALGQVPKTLKGTLYSLDLGSLFAGAGKGEYEERVKGVIEDVKRSQETDSPVILFIDEMHLLCVGKGNNQSGMDAANLLKPELARGQFRCIGATTYAEYREYIEKDGALTRRFAQVTVNEPTVEQAITILRGSRDRYANHHAVWIEDAAIVTAVNLAHRYLTARRLPDSAFDLMDEACAAARLQQDLQPEYIEAVEQHKKHKETYIRALENEDHDDNQAALDEARNAWTELRGKGEKLQRAQEEVEKWWDSLAAHRRAIREKKDEILEARGATLFNPKQINQVERDLQLLREQFRQLQQRGPDYSKEAKEALSSWHASPMSPDIITPENIAIVVEKATKIPVRQLLDTDKERLLYIDEALRKKVIGQPEAVAAVANAIQISRTGLGNANRPIACLLFTGPSGTGKTLLSKALAEELFGQSTAMVRVDGSEYSQSHSVSRLIGAPPGYVGYDQGGQLTEYVRRTPYCIVLLDEIEKTCLEFLTLFLQVMDEGKLTDGQGRVVDFRNTVIIMTSNVGADDLGTVRGTAPISNAIKDQVMLKFRARGFPPEFLNRLDDVVMFRPIMDGNMMKGVLNRHIEDVKKRDGLKEITLNLDHNAEMWLIKKGISSEYGARLLARVIQTYLLNPLARAILDKKVVPKAHVFVRVRGEGDGSSLEITSSSQRR